jgi:ribosome-associated protein
MSRRAAPHRGTDVHYGSLDDAADDAIDSGPSKTQLKQQSHALQALGVELAALSNERFAAIEMPEILRDAITAYRKTRSHEGRRRQMQYVGKLMRKADEDSLREAVAQATVGTAKQTLALHQAEGWRAELIAHDDAMTRWLKEFPQTDSQQLRSLVRAARREAALPAEKRNVRTFRELFQFIRPMLDDGTQPVVAAAFEDPDTPAHGRALQ